MKNKKISYILLSIVISLVALIFIIAIITDDKVNGNFLHRWVSNRNITENQLKMFVIIPLFVIGFFNTPYTEKEIKIENSLILATFCFIIFIVPVNTLTFLPPTVIAGLYVFIYISLISFAFIISSYFFSKKILRDQFNLENETFDQTRKKIETPLSLNLKYRFYWQKKYNEGWVNMFNVFSGIWIFGLMNSGKSFTWFLQAIYQFLKKDFTLAIYDYKFPELTNITYNMHKTLGTKAKFYAICLDDASISNRLNPIMPKYIPNVQDIDVISEIIMKSDTSQQFNKFFDGSAQGIFTALIYILKKWQRKYGEEVCSIPHAMVLSSVKIDFILPLLLAEREVLMQVTSLRDAFTNEDARGQLAGQVGSLSNILRSLISKDMMYILTGNDLDLELNNPQAPKILCIGSSQKKSSVTAPIISVILEMIARENNVVNKPKKPFMIMGDEFARVFFKSVTEYVSSGRGNQCGLMAGMQGVKQLEELLKRETASTIMDISANLICGKAGNDTARYVSERLGKTQQKKTNITENNEGDISLNHTTDKDYLVSQSRISTLGTGEFCGTIVDEYNNTLKQKRFFGDFEFDKEIYPILEKKEKIENKIIIPKEKIDYYYNLHLSEMETFNFFEELHEYLDHGVSKKSYIFEYYSIFFDFENSFINKIKYSNFDENIKHTEQEIKELIKSELRTKIESKELEKFLTDHQNEIYDQIEKYVKLEYQEILGKPLFDDLFNVETKEEILLTKENYF